MSSVAINRPAWVAQPVFRRPVPRLAVVSIWAALIALLLEVPVWLSGSRLQNPYARPERAAVLRAWNEMHGTECEVLFIGDSRTGAAFTPAAMEDEARGADITLRAFNLAGPSSTILSEAGVLDYVLDRGARPRVVIWGVGKRQASLVDLGMFQRNEATLGLVSDLSWREPGWRNVCTWGFYATGAVRRLLQMPLEFLPQYRHELAAARHNRGIGWAEETTEWGRRHNDRRMGSAPRTPAHWEAAVARVRKDKNAVTPFVEHPLVNSALAYAVRRVRQAGGQVVLVNVPLVSGRTELERGHGYDEYTAWLQRSAREHRLRLVDLNEPGMRPPDEQFDDTDHLGPDAAGQVTRRLTREIILPQLKASGGGPP